MKTQLKNPIKNFAPIFLMLVTMLLMGFGCNTSKPTPDPLTGFHFCFDQDPHKLNKTIQDDYQDYIRKLPPEEKTFATYDNDFEDGTGQHAVLITVGLNGTNWRHVLIYDKNDKRIKTIKYVSGHSAS